MPNRLTWWGHSSWRLETSQGLVVLFDAWLSHNPVAPLQITHLDRADFLLLSHDHADHASDTVAIVKQTGATLVAQPETLTRYQSEGVPDEKGIGMNIGGTIDLGGLRCTMTEAYHSSETGEPAGYILTLEDGKTLYFAGDTGVHSNMALWGQLFAIDVALLPIGSVFTMDGRQAAHALRMLRAKAALPMHYKTFPLLAQSADDFVAHAKAQAPVAKVHVIDIGGTFEF